MDYFIQRASESSIRQSKFLYIFAALVTAWFIQGESPVSKNKLYSIVEGLDTIVVIVLVFVALFRLVPLINSILHFSGGAKLRIGEKRKFLSHIVLVSFFVWLSGLLSVITNSIHPEILKTTIIKSGIETTIAIFIAGPTEELWRWTFILAFFYIGSKVFPRIHRLLIFWIGVSLSCILFGIAHIGEVKGYSLLTWSILTVSGLLLFLYAYWARSFWIAVLVHIIYDLIGILPFTKTLMVWWPIVGILWVAVVIFYFKWRKFSSN